MLSSIETVEVFITQRDNHMVVEVTFVQLDHPPMSLDPIAHAVLRWQLY